MIKVIIFLLLFSSCSIEPQEKVYIYEEVTREDEKITTIGGTIIKPRPMPKMKRESIEEKKKYKEDNGTSSKR